MFVWEVREEIPYEGNKWSVLVRDDDGALEKVKGVVIKELMASLEGLTESIKSIENNSEQVFLSLRPDNKTRIAQLEKGINDLKLTISYVELLTSLSDWKTVHNRGYDIEVEKLEVL